jgi:hypothetical protein
MMRPIVKIFLLGVLIYCWGCEDRSPRLNEQRDTDTLDASLALDLTIEDASPDALTIDYGVDVMLPDAAEPRPYPDPSAWGPNEGPGGPNVTFNEEELYQNCAFVDVGPDDPTNHRNLVTMFNGYLLLPWSPEFGRTGGVSFFDVSDPCAPTRVGHGTTDLMRETHAVGFSTIGGRWAVTSHARAVINGGILFWDISNIETPTVASAIELPGFFYPDAYARISFSNFWQGPYVYVGGADNGVWIVDATDPTSPTFVNQYTFEPVLRAAQVQAIGNLLVVTSGEGTRTVLLDISDPANPQPIPGGDFLNTSGDGEPREIYFSTTSDGYIYYARKDGGGGPLIWDIHDPENPVFSAEYLSDGNGGYAAVKEGYAFIGESNFAGVYDIRDHNNITEVTRLNLEGDLDTATPVGNVVFLSVDDKGNRGEGTSVAPWRREPDATPPHVTWAWPSDGATNLATTSRLGLTFSEHIDVLSAWEGSVRLYESGTDPALTRVDGYISAQESIVNFWPINPLKPNTTYTLEVPAGGVSDFNGNAIADPFTLQVTTGSR